MSFLKSWFSAAKETADAVFLILFLIASIMLFSAMLFVVVSFWALLALGGLAVTLPFTIYSYFSQNKS